MLTDYQKWKEANSSTNFSLYDYIHGVTIDKAIPLDFHIALLKLYYPEFIVIRNHVFLKEEYEESKYLELVEQNYEKQEIEYWMNLLNIDSLFAKEQVKASGKYMENFSYIGKQIANLWLQKLNNDFPNKKFCVDCLKDDNETYIVFYETI